MLKRSDGAASFHCGGIFSPEFALCEYLRRIVMSGPDALSTHQYKSSLACTVIAIILLEMVVIGIFINAGMGAVMVAIVAVLIALLSFPCLYSSIKLYQSMSSGVVSHEDSENDAPYLQSWTYYIISVPKDWYCWFRFVVGTTVLFLWPMIYQYAALQPKSGTITLIIGIISTLRYNLKASSIINEYATLSNIQFAREGGAQSSAFGLLENEDANAQESEQTAGDFIARARASEIIGKISSNRMMWLWVLVYGVIVVLFLGWTLDSNQELANGSPAADPSLMSSQTEERDPIRLLDDFYYPPQPGVSYPTCHLNKEFLLPGQDITYIRDYNIFAAMSYEVSPVTNYILGKWFNDETYVVEESDLVRQWRDDSGNSDARVSFKLFSIPSQPGYGIVAIRGTDNRYAWDQLLNYVRVLCHENEMRIHIILRSYPLI